MPFIFSFYFCFDYRLHKTKREGNWVNMVEGICFEYDRMSDTLMMFCKNVKLSFNINLGFKDKDGNWITRRFLFSKWTLREGWDNPNVFVLL